MKQQSVLISVIAGMTILVLSACAARSTPTVALQSTAALTRTSVPLSSTPVSAATDFDVKSDSSGSVVVDVKPIALAAGQPVLFEIAMNTHSVNLADDMVQASLLRDDTGREYKPTAWDGAGPGGHHRSGTLVFGALVGKPKYVELVIKGVAKVPERVFHWDLVQ